MNLVGVFPNISARKTWRWLRRSYGRMKLQGKEAVYINAINPTEYKFQQGILNLKYGYEFDPIWSCFNQDIRKIVKKKIKFAH